MVREAARADACSEAERAVAACRKAGVVFALGNNKRCFPSMTELRRVVAEGQIGEVLHVEAHFCNEHSTRVVAGGWRDDPNEVAGRRPDRRRPAPDRRAGQPRRSDRARSTRSLFERKPPPDPRDVIALQVTFANGGTGQLASVRAAPAYWRVHVFGTKGWAEARDETTLTVAPNGQSPQTQTYPPADSLAVLLESFAEAIELGTPFLVPTGEMLAVVGAFEAAIASLAVGPAGRGATRFRLTSSAAPSGRSTTASADVAVYIMKALR